MIGDVFNRRSSGFTATDLVIVAATVVVLFGLASTGFNPLRPGCKCARITCVNNLRQLGLACRVWSNDNGDKFPMSVSTNAGGALEFAKVGDVHSIFQVISNEFYSPKILICPKDTEHKAAKQIRRLTDRNISYFVGLDADEMHPQAILSGDRNISTNGRIMSGILTLPASSPVAWTIDMHDKNGNLGLADGSAQQTTDFALLQSITNMLSAATNPMRLAIPSK
jgi:hypothetical protein